MITSLSAFYAIAASNSTIGFESKTVEAGETVELNLSIKDNPGIAGIAVSIKYDDTALKLVETRKGSLFSGFTADRNFIWDESKNVTDDGILATFVFKVSESALASNYNVDIIVRSCVNEDLDDIDKINISNGIITVLEKPVAVTGVILEKNTLSIKSGEEQTLNATISPDNATNKNLTWKSSDENIVTVDKNGVVAGVKKGTTTVTVTTEDGSYTDTCTVNVECSHNVTTTYPAKQSTCIEQGNSEYTVCNDCGIVVKGSNDKLPFAKHNYVEVADVKYLKASATCKDKAVYYKSCSVCKAQGTDTFSIGEVNPENHVGDTYLVNQKDATCNETGYTGDIYCKSCNKIISKGKSIPASEHISDGKWQQIIAPTCTEPGKEVQKCKDCNAVISERIVPAKGHSFGDWKTVTEATCISEGTQIRTCYCGETESRVIPKTEHKAGDWTVTLSPTCNSAGEKVQKCSVCDKILATQSIPANDHTPNEFIVTKEATCTENGERKAICSICGEEIIETIPSTGHQFGDWVIIKDATDTEKGMKERVCSVCEEKETVEIPIIDTEKEPAVDESTTSKNDSTKPSDSKDDKVNSTVSKDNVNKNNSTKSPNTGFDVSNFVLISMLFSVGIVLSTVIVVISKKRKTVK